MLFIPAPYRDYFEYDENLDSEMNRDLKPTTEIQKKLFGVYTNVSAFDDWIRNNSDYTGCKPSN